jgi:hypothetical protein
VQYPGWPPANTGGREYLGADPFDRFYPTSDGWVRLQARHPAAVTPSVLATAGLPVDEAVFADDPAAGLGAALAGNGEHSREVLREAGLAEADIDDMVRSGVVTVAAPMPQSLPTAYR